MLQRMPHAQCRGCRSSPPVQTIEAAFSRGNSTASVAQTSAVAPTAASPPTAYPTPNPSKHKRKPAFQRLQAPFPSHVPHGVTDTHYMLYPKLQPHRHQAPYLLATACCYSCRSKLNYTNRSIRCSLTALRCACHLSMNCCLVDSLRARAGARGLSTSCVRMWRSMPPRPAWRASSETPSCRDTAGVSTA